MKSKVDPKVWLRGKRPTGYKRSSTKKQGKDDRFGPKNQQRAQEQAAKWYKTKPIARFYEEQVSGTGALKRSEFREAVAAGKRHEYDVLFVFDVSRFARNETDAWTYLDALTLAGTAVWFCEEEILCLPKKDDPGEEWRTEVGDAINSAARYSRKLRRTMQRTHENKWQDGGWIGLPPFGYRRTKDKMTLEPHPETAPVRKLMTEEFAANQHSSLTLARWLTTKGYALRLARRDGQLGPAFAFKAGTVRNLLNDPIVVGKLYRKRGTADEVVRDEPGVRLVTDASYKAVLRRLAGNRYALSKPGAQKHVYLFGQAARCATCGERFYGETTTEGYARVVHAEDKGCDADKSARPARNERKLATRLGKWLEAWTLPVSAQRAFAVYAAKPKPVSLSLNQRRAKLQAELKRLGFQHRNGLLDDADFLREAKDLRKVLDGLPPSVAPVVAAPNAIGLLTVAKAWRIAPADKRRAFVTEWFEQVQLGPHGSMLVRVREPYRAFVRTALGQKPSGRQFEFTIP